MGIWLMSVDLILVNAEDSGTIMQQICPKNIMACKAKLGKSISVERGGRRGNYPGARAPRGPENSVYNGIKKPMQHYGCIK